MATSRQSWKPGQKCAQPYFAFSAKTESWEPIVPGDASFADINPDSITELTILSWNIDFRCPLAKPRMKAALKYLEGQVHELETLRPVIIFFQEMVSSDLAQIQSESWIRERFFVTDVSTSFWETKYYGTCTMVPKSLSITSVFRTHYEQTSMGRDALFVDIALEADHRLRICNTHLESLIADPPVRPSQLSAAAQVMQEPAVFASVLGGDLNAIQPFDKVLHLENGLRDAYLSAGGIEDHESGFTWGQMAKTSERVQFGLSRMDKFLYSGSVQIKSFKTFGYGVEVDAESDRVRLIEHGLEGGWVTDHLGIRGDFRLAHSDSRL